MFTSDTCPKCHAEIPSGKDFCSKCGTHRVVYDDNYCTNPDCKCYKVLLKDPRQYACDICGSLTVFGKMNDELC